jgi:hypothetical protein
MFNVNSYKWNCNYDVMQYVMIPATTIQESPAQEIGNRSPWLKSIFLVALHFPVPSIFQPSTAEEKKKKTLKIKHANRYSISQFRNKIE